MTEDKRAKQLLIEAVDRYCREQGCDLLLFSGEITEGSGRQFVDTVLAADPAHRRVSLFLTTYGGDPHAAYRIMRTLQARYEEVCVLVAGPCKSAGTLMAVGADVLRFGPKGELGPIDIQMAKQDDIVLSSGLDTIQGLESLLHQTFTGFESYLLKIMSSSGGAISTRTASEIASQLVTGIFQPIAGQIDPHRLGEVERAMSIALAYGERLLRENASFETLVQLVHGYPSHGFVIDFGEAGKLFSEVHVFSPEEMDLASLLGELVARPQHSPVSMDLSRLLSEGEHDESTHREGQSEAGVDGPPEPPRSPRRTAGKQSGGKRRAALRATSEESGNGRHVDQAAAAGAAEGRDGT